jgi:hypothetical protein
MAIERVVDRADDPILRIRERRSYNDAERWFSQILRQRLKDVIEARCNFLVVLRRYPDEPNRLGIMPTPAKLPREQLRLSVIRELVYQTIDFVRADESGGPVAQSVAPDGSIFEVQAFTTKYPHIIIERTDHYPVNSLDPSEITWCLRRVQNQRQQTEINRLIDAAGLVVNLIKVFV